MSGTIGGGHVGGVDSSIALQAGRGVQNNGLMAQSPHEFANTLSSFNQLSLFPLRQQELQQQLELQRLGITKGGIENQGAQAALTQRLNDITANGMSSLALDENGTVEGVQARLGQLHASGVNVEGLTKGFATSGAHTPQDIQAYWRNQFLMTHPELAVPKYAPRDVGGKIVYVDENPFTNRGLGGKELTKGLTPAEATTPTPIGVTPGGAPISGTRQQFIDLTQPGADGGGAGSKPAGVVTELAPADKAAQTTQGGTSAEWFSKIGEEGVQARNQGATLGNMLADASQFVSGPTRVNTFKSTLTRYAPTMAASFGIDPKSVAANESFDKLAAQIQSAQGAGTDTRLAVSGLSNPSSHLSQQGVDLIIRQLQGNTDYIQARAKLAANWPEQGNRAKFENEIAENLDPRAFQFERLTKPQRVEYAKSLSEADAAKVEKAYDWAVKHRIIGGG